MDSAQDGGREVAALGDVAGWPAGGCPGEECLWQESGTLADEFMNADFRNTRQDIDQRTIASNNPMLDYDSHHAGSRLHSRRHSRDGDLHARGLGRHRRVVHGARIRKAFWTFGRGQRLSDLRRLIRQW